MKNVNTKVVIERLKTIALTATIIGIAAFGAGVRYEQGNSARLQAAVKVATGVATTPVAAAVPASK